jgi:hypothetical protein
MFPLEPEELRRVLDHSDRTERMKHDSGRTRRH